MKVAYKILIIDKKLSKVPMIIVNKVLSML